MFVYVTYDPLYEKVLCVHAKPNKFCKVCRPVWNQRKRDDDYAYQIYEVKRLVRGEKTSSFSPELQAEILRVEKLGIDLLEQIKKIKA